MDTIESNFARAVANAASSDDIALALCDLWEYVGALGHAEVAAIADRYTTHDANGQPRRRQLH